MNSRILQGLRTLWELIKHPLGRDKPVFDKHSHRATGTEGD